MHLNLGQKNWVHGMVEYALIIAFVALVVFASLVLLGPQIAHAFTQVSPAL